MYVYACEVFRWKKKMSFRLKKCYDEYACQIRQEDAINKWIEYYHSPQFSNEYDIRDDELNSETDSENDDNKLHRVVLIKKRKSDADYSVIVLTVTRYELILQ